MAIKIDDNVPLPSCLGSGREKGEFRLAIEGLEVGQSIFMEGDRTKTSSLRQTAQAAAQAVGIKVTSRKTTEAGRDGLRFWRFG